MCAFFPLDEEAIVRLNDPHYCSPQLPVEHVLKPKDVFAQKFVILLSA